MRKLLFLALLLSLLLPTPKPAAAAPPLQGSPSTVIALINDYRASNGLGAYQQNSILSTIAQGQADWIASQGSPGDIHAGPGGSRPRDRAYAAGYGGGEQIFISEIAVYGLGMSPDEAISWWKGSQIHNDTMLASTYVETGCGVATDGNNRYYYVCAMGYVVGGSYTPSGSGSTTSEEASAPAVVIIPVTKSEPQPDGSVVHIIRTGQALWNVSAVYEVPLQDILDLNDLPEWAFVQPGDEILVKPPGSEPTSTPTINPEEPTATETAPPASPTASMTADTGQVLAASSTPTALPPVSQALPAGPASAANTTVFWVVGLALASIIAVFVASFFIQRPGPPLPTDDNDPFAPIE